MTNDLLTKENLTTFATWAAIAITPIFTYFGIQIDQGALIAVLSMIATLVIAVYSSKHPNTLETFGNNLLEHDEVLEIVGEAMKEVIQKNNIDESKISEIELGIEVDEDDQ